MKPATILVTVALAFSALAWSAGRGAAQQAATNPLAGQVFRSLDKLPGGERRDGKIVQIFWTITFDDKSFRWLNYDKIVPGTYTFDAKTGTVTLNDGKLQASFDAKTGILTWANRKYKNAKSEK